MLTLWDRFAQRATMFLDRAEGVGAFADPSAAGSPATRRLHELDGIRGWAALCVVVFHVFYETLGLRFPVFRNPVTHTLNGSFAVFVFFVLSGEALSTPYFGRNGLRAIASLAVKRHSRLSLPIFGSVLLVWALQHAGLIYSAQAAVIVGRADWLGTFAVAPVSLAEVVKYSAMDVYATADPTRHVIPFLWTMSAEMIGSIFVFALLGAYEFLYRRTLLLTILIALLVVFHESAFLAPFVAGILFGAARRRGVFDRLMSLRSAQIAATLLILLPLAILYRHPVTSDPRFNAALAIVLVGAIFTSRWATAFFRLRISRLLGRISFPLYLVHFSVLVSLTSGMIVHQAAAGTFGVGDALWIGLASVLVSFAAAVAFEPVELLTKRLGHRIGAAFVVPSGHS